MWTMTPMPARRCAIVENAKTQRYGTCNTAESLLVARGVAAAQLPEARHDAGRQGRRAARCAESLALLRGAGIDRNEAEGSDGIRTGTRSTSPPSSP
jgi:gamma-glutamyl phosphate reductase